MNFLGIGTGELLLILLIVLLVMGPERLPQLIRQWARVVKTLSQFTRTWQQFNAELNRQLTLEDLADERPRPRPTPAPAQPAPPESASNSIAPPELAQLDAAGPLKPGAAEPSGESGASAVPDAQAGATPSAAAEEPHHEQ
jgi:sec-independent protein translocase protein TatB